MSVYKKRYRCYLLWGVFTAILGLAITIVSVLCIMILTDEWHIALTFQAVSEFRPVLSSIEWRLCLFLYYLRYPGPVLAGMGIFALIMISLFIDWLAEQEVSKCGGRRARNPNIYDKLALSWQNKRRKLEQKQTEFTRQYDSLLLNYKARDSLSTCSDNRSFTNCQTSNSTPVKTHTLSNGLTHLTAKRSLSARGRMLHRSPSTSKHPKDYSPMSRRPSTPTHSNSQSKCLIFTTFATDTPQIEKRSSRYYSCHNSVTSSYETSSPRADSLTSSTWSYHTAEDDAFY